MRRWNGSTGPIIAASEPIGNIPPAEAEEFYYPMLEQPVTAGIIAPIYPSR